MMWIFFLLILHFTFSQDMIPSYIFYDCKHLILPARCQCYHSGHESQLRCLKSELHSLPKLTNNMRWNALDFSYNYITSVDNYVFADIYVEKISLNSNYLRQIETTAFDQIKNLKELYINHNQLKGLHPDTLISPGSSLGTHNLLCLLHHLSFSSIEIFDLSHNPFQYLDMGQILLNLPLLKRFRLTSCHLNNTSIYTLSKLIEIENNQTMIRRGHYHLEILDLSHNNLTKICHHLFDGLYNLLELRLDHNFIRLIDNNFLQPFQKLQFLNLAHNHIENVPKLSSPTLQILNYSSNHIHYLTDYFASNLLAIRSIDFDHNHHLNNTSPRAFCFLNIQTLEKLTFRSNNLYSLNHFGEFLCRLANQTDRMSLIDINNNINLKCNCTLIQFERYFSSYHDLTCTQHTQDRYYVSKLTDWIANCPVDFCMKREKQYQSDFCNWSNAERAVSEGTCEAKLAASEEKKRNRAKLMSTLPTVIDSSSSDNLTINGNLTNWENSTRSRNEKSFQSKSNLFQMNIDLLIMNIFISLLF